MFGDFVLVVGGVLAGLVASVAGLASVISYPALLAAGLPPLSANVTNTTAMTVTMAGPAFGARVELSGIWRRTALLCGLAGVGGLLGAGLLLSMPPQYFVAVVPWLVAFGSVLLLCRDAFHRWMTDARRRRDGRSERRWPIAVSVMAVGTYSGYFGAAGGVLMLAALSLSYAEPFAVTNAVKTVVAGAANATATAVYLLIAPVDWALALWLGVGMLIGSSLGPRLVRVLPAAPLRRSIGVAGLLLAVWLWLQ